MISGIQRESWNVFPMDKGGLLDSTPHSPTSSCLISVSFVVKILERVHYTSTHILSWIYSNEASIFTVPLKWLLSRSTTVFRWSIFWPHPIQLLSNIRALGLCPPSWNTLFLWYPRLYCLLDLLPLWLCLLSLTFPNSKARMPQGSELRVLEFLTP